MMNRCPITYQECGEQLFSEKGLKLLSPALKALIPLDFTAHELRQQAMEGAAKYSIQGDQPKINAVLNINQGFFEPVVINGKYIIKPQHQVFTELPQNEDLTMRLAAAIGIEVPVHGLIWCKDRSLAYFVKRFDREGQKNRIAVEDFAQLAGLTRETKYDYSMEQLIKLVDDYCTFPLIEKVKLFTRVLFCYLTGNEDMHLKNYSVISRNGKIELSPAYDLINTSIVLKRNLEEIALPLHGMKSNFTREILFDYFGKEQCGLNEKIIQNIIESTTKVLPYWFELIDISFISQNMRENYKRLLKERINILELNYSSLYRSTI
jgi:serine/threonine-protein kinase HipA